MPNRVSTWLLSETGLRCLLASPRDSKLICVQRFVRLFAYGASSLILALFLQDIGISEQNVGLFMTLTLVGDVVISLFLTTFADGLGRKNILSLGSVLMILSGVMFALCEQYWVLLLAAIVGVISPSGNEIGPFRAIEESTLAQLSPRDHRSDIFAWYTLLGTFGTSVGNLVCGWIVEKLQRLDGWTKIDAYRVIFMVYAGIGSIKLILCIFLTKSCEYNSKPNKGKARRAETVQNGTVDGSPEEEPLDDPSQPLLPDHRSSDSSNKSTLTSAISKLVPSLTPASRLILLKITLLFTLDSLASGLVPISWLAVFFHDRHALSSGLLGTLFASTSLVAAFSNIISASIARRLGLLKTMVFTHLPSSLFLALIPFAQSRGLAVTWLVLRSCTATMDTAPKQAFVAAAVLEQERTAVMGWINVVKTLAQSVGPAVTGWLVARGLFWVSFVLAGGLKVGYDLGVGACFWGFGGREEESGEGDEGTGRS